MGLNASNRALGVLLLVSFTPACAQVLGIEDAVEDPGLSNLSGGAAGQGGSAQSGAGQGSKASGGQGSDGAGGSGDAGSGGNAGGAGGTAGKATVCEEYCSDMEAYCETDYPQYKDREQCLKTCGVLPPGELGGADENSAACRLKYAGKARYAAGTELAAYCRQAGPGGDGRCGSNCEGYCAVMMVACTQDSSPLYHYQGPNDCLAACQALPPSDISYDVRDPLVFDGNHVQCRLFHATSGLMADADEHCEHAMGVTLCEG